MKLRRLGDSGLWVSPVGLGTWPLSGMTSLHVNDSHSLETIEGCFSNGINFIDTAYAYGTEGESERLIARALGSRRDEFVIASKVGVHWDARAERRFDARPETIRRECEESLRRLNTDRVDLLYLHAPDPRVAIADSAGALKELQETGKVRAIGASNLNVKQLEEFHAICPLTAFQPPYNLLQRQIESDLLPWCRQRRISVVVYWPLMKGLLAGHLHRRHRFEPGDKLAAYPMFRDPEWQRNQDFLDELRALAAALGRTVSQIAVNWVIFRPGVTAALCGAKRRWQIDETAAAMGWQLGPEALKRIDAALLRRGTPIVQEA